MKAARDRDLEAQYPNTLLAGITSSKVKIVFHSARMLLKFTMFLRSTLKNVNLHKETQLRTSYNMSVLVKGSATRNLQAMLMTSHLPSVCCFWVYLLQFRSFLNSVLISRDNVLQNKLCNPTFWTPMCCKLSNFLPCELLLATGQGITKPVAHWITKDWKFRVRGCLSISISFKTCL